MHKLGATEPVVITHEDVEAFNRSPYVNVGVGGNKDGAMEVMLMTQEESEAAIRQFGGAPGDS